MPPPKKDEGAVLIRVRAIIDRSRPASVSHVLPRCSTTATSPAGRVRRPCRGYGRRLTGTIIEFYTQLEINKGGKLDDRLKDTGTNRPVRLQWPRKHTPQLHQQGNRDRPKRTQRPLDHEPAHHPRRVAPQPTPARPLPHDFRLLTRRRLLFGQYSQSDRTQTVIDRLQVPVYREES